MKRFILALLMVSTVLVQHNSALADNQPRDYLPAPPGCLALLFYYNHLTADSLYNDGEKVIDDLDFSANVGIFRAVYYFELGGFELAPNLLIPFGDMDFEVPGVADLSATGVGDPIFLTAVWLYRNPESKTWLGVAPYFFFPVGDYDNDGALSLGANRWRFREEANFTQGFQVLPGHNAYFELTLAGDFFTDNDEFGAQKQTQSRDPYLTVESHLSYDVTSSIFASADYYYHHGGETSIAGIDQRDRLNNHTIGFTLGYNIAPSFQVLLQYTGDVDVESGPKTQGVLFRFLYACDVGYLFGSPAAANK